MTRIRSIAALLVVAATAAVAQQYTVYVGTYTAPRSSSKGIYAYRFQPATGKLTSIGLVAESASPSFLAIHPNQRFLYAANEINNYEGQRAGSISAFSIDAASAKLTPLNRVTSRGAGPAHLAVDQTGKSLLAANYGGGSIAAFPIHEDGSLGEASRFIQYEGVGFQNPGRQAGPHPHETVLSPDNRFVLVPDLGLDLVLTYRLDSAKAELTPGDAPPAKVKPGLGPRHLVFHSNGRFVYLLNELGSAVIVFAYDSRNGSLKELQTITTLPKDFSGRNDSGEVQIHPNGKFLYASNRGHDSIAVFAVDARTGMLTTVENVPTGGKLPRNFAIDPTGAYLLMGNSAADKIVVFRIDPQTGKLSPTGDTLDMPSPVCIVFVPER